MTEMLPLFQTGVDLVKFFCPGCNTTHQVKIDGEGAWDWNKSYEKPTFSPSLLITGGHYRITYQAGDSCWCTYKEKYPEEKDTLTCQRCHSVVKDGMIQFLDDCSHELKGQTVPMVPCPFPFEV